MARWCGTVIRFGALVAAAGIPAAGCSPSNVLPNVAKASIQAPAAIPQGASPVCAWHGSRSDLQTYWGLQQAVVEVRGYLPENYKDARDGFWEVKARSGDGKPIPFVGVIRRYLNENGTQLAEIVPKVDQDKIPDCLCVVIDPNVKLDGGKVASIQPVAIIYEIRDHEIKPYRMKVPLIPESESALTPKPVVPDTPKGTPIPVH